MSNYCISLDYAQKQILCRATVLASVNIASVQRQTSKYEVNYTREQPLDRKLAHI